MRVTDATGTDDENVGVDAVRFRRLSGQHYIPVLLNHFRCPNYLENGGFEQGRNPNDDPYNWDETVGYGARLVWYWGPENVPQGTWGAWFGGWDQYDMGGYYDELYQDILVPENATEATLTFYWRMTTREDGSGGGDRDDFRAKILDPWGNSLAAICYRTLFARSGFYKNEAGVFSHELYEFVSCQFVQFVAE